MRIIFKKFRTRMIVGCILAVIALLAVSVVVFINQPSFGRTPRGERLERVMKSPNYRDGGYDTHYAEIGNRFPNIDLAILENGQYDKEWSWFFVKFGGNLFFISTVSLFFFLNPIKSCRYVCFLVTLKTPHH